MMNDDELKLQTEKVLRDARKAIYEAEKIISKTEDYLFKNKINLNKLSECFNNLDSQKFQQEIDKMVEKITQEINDEADRSFQEFNSQQKHTHSKRGFRKFI